MAPRLTLFEIRDLFSAVQDTLGIPQVVAAVTPVLGQAVVAEILSSNVDRKMTEDETCNLIFALEPIVPGADTEAKLLWLMRESRRVFPDQARYEEVRQYVFDELHQFRLEVENVAPQRAIRPIRQGDSQAFYGRVNFWAEDWGTLLQDLSECQKNGVSYAIEMAAWAGTGVWNDPAKLDSVCETYKRLVAECRQRGLWLFVSCLNQNMELAKYGNVPIHLADVLPQAQRLVQTVKECGPENVLFQPVAESSRKEYHDFEDYCAAQLSGFHLVYNGGGGTPDKKASWASFRAWHPSSVTASVPADAFAVSDHGTTIKQLNQNGGLNTPGNPTAIKAWFAKHAAAGCPVVCLYHFQQRGHDAEAIRACALSSQANPTQPTGDDADLSKAVWYGPNGASATVSETLSDLRMNAEKISYSMSAGCAAWGPAQGEKQTTMLACFFVFRDGKWRGGKFDHSSYSRKDRETTNIYGKYTGGIVPANGETVRVCMLSNDLKHRTNAPSIAWVGKS